MIRITNKSKSIIKRDSNVFLTTTREIFPLVVDHADGDFVYDVEGNRFIDFTTFITVYPLGNNSTGEVRKAIKQQVDRLMHGAFTDFHAELPVKFGEKLLTQFPPGFGKIFLSNSGTEANEAAIKLARIFTKRQYIIAFYGAFHGRTLGSLSLTSSKSVQREHFGPFNGVIHAPEPNPYRCMFDHSKYECGEDAAAYIKENIFKKEVSPKEVAAIIVEPVQGEGGYIVPPKRFFTEIRKICTENRILMIDDEVQAGYMRTGKFLALDNFGVKADIYTMAKAVGGGLPMGVTVAKRSLGDLPAGAHSNTFGGNLAIVAGAYAQLNHVIRNKRRLENEARQKGKIIMRELARLKENYERVGDVRGLGMMTAVEFVKDKESKRPAPELRDRVMMRAFNNGLLLLPAGESSIRLIPPITMKTGTLEKGLRIFADAVKSEA